MANKTRSAADMERIRKSNSEVGIFDPKTGKETIHHANGTTTVKNGAKKGGKK